MSIRTDLALEATENVSGKLSGVAVTEKMIGKTKVTRLKVISDDAAAKLRKEKGTYITCEFGRLTGDISSQDERLGIISELIRDLIPKSGCVLVVGIGNHNITPDALGPKAAEKVLATRHIGSETARALGLDRLRQVCVLSPGVLGQTGIEVCELLCAVIKKAGVTCVIAVDALASRSLRRLGCTVQISDTGISPGAGVGNRRSTLGKSTLGVPVVSVGVPTVVDAATLAADILAQGSLKGDIRKIVPPAAAQMIVTPREIDLLTERAAALIGMSINCALQPQLTTEELFALC